MRTKEDARARLLRRPRQRGKAFLPKVSKRFRPMRSQIQLTKWEKPWLQFQRATPMRMKLTGKEKKSSPLLNCPFVVILLPPFCFNYFAISPEQVRYPAPRLVIFKADYSMAAQPIFSVYSEGGHVSEPATN